MPTCGRSSTSRPGSRPPPSTSAPGTGSSVREVIDAARDASGVDIPVQDTDRRAGDPVAIYGDNRRAADLLGWRPDRNLTTIVVERLAVALHPPRRLPGLIRPTSVAGRHGHAPSPLGGPWRRHPAVHWWGECPLPACRRSGSGGPPSGRGRPGTTWRRPRRPPRWCGRRRRSAVQWKNSSVPSAVAHRAVARGGRRTSATVASTRRMRARRSLSGRSWRSAAR